MYKFDIIGVAPVLYFFNYQQTQEHMQTGVAYVSSYECSLDALIKSVEGVAYDQNWDMDVLVRSVLDFWLDNWDSVKYWKLRLQDAGEGMVLVGRVGDDRALRKELEVLFRMQK